MLISWVLITWSNLGAFWKFITEPAILAFFISQKKKKKAKTGN